MSCEPAPPSPLPPLSQPDIMYNPRANVFIMVNLGCEMLYVIDQRLQAQQIASEKATQVMHDVTSVLLEPKFIDSLVLGSRQQQAQLLTEDHCKFMLKDIATCSLMRLDDVSMDKLWNLMTMVYKWQLFHTSHQYQLMDITFRHLATIGDMYTDEKRTALIDLTKNTLLDFWNACSDEEQHSMYVTNKLWLDSFGIKISLLIRLGFQTLDGTFLHHVNESYFNDFISSLGDNIYAKSADIAAQKKQELANLKCSPAPVHCVDQLAEMLNCPQSPSTNEVLKPINFRDFQKQYERNLQQCNILFEDLDVNVANANSAAASSSAGSGAFVHLNATYSRQNVDSSAPSSSHAPRSARPLSAADKTATVVHKDLLELYSKLN